MPTMVSTKAAALAGMILFMAAPADAGPRAWVSSTGGGIACTRAAPCATFSDAIAVVDPGGEINCVDAADYGPIADFPRSVTIDCSKTGASIDVNIGAGEGIRNNTEGAVVTLRGITIKGLGVGTFGIVINASGELHVEHCQIFGFNHPQVGTGIIVSPPVSGLAKLYVSDTLIHHNGVFGHNGFAVWLQPSGSASVVAVLNRVQLSDDAGGIRARGDQTTGSV